MAQTKMFNGKEYRLVKRTPYKREANSTKDAYKRDFHIRVEKQGNVWYVWARRK